VDTPFSTKEPVENEAAPDDLVLVAFGLVGFAWFFLAHRGSPVSATSLLLPETATILPDLSREATG
jgi:hypothetical protein